MSLPIKYPLGPEPVRAAPRFRHSHKAGGTREREVVKARDVPQRNRQIGRWLLVRSVEGALFRGVLIHAHVEVERSLDIRYRPRDIHEQPIGSGARHCQTIRLRETNHRVVILLRRSEPLGELLHAEELVVRGALRIVNLLQQFVEFRLVA